MKAFAQLFQALDATTAQSAKLAALVAYLRVVPPADAAWATYFLAGGKPRQMVPTKRLKALAQEAAGLPEWLFEESYQAVGDLAETVSLLLPPASAPVEQVVVSAPAEIDWSRCRVPGPTAHPRRRCATCSNRCVWIWPTKASTSPWSAPALSTPH